MLALADACIGGCLHWRMPALMNACIDECLHGGPNGATVEKAPSHPHDEFHSVGFVR